MISTPSQKASTFSTTQYNHQSGLSSASAQQNPLSPQGDHNVYQVAPGPHATSISSLRQRYHVFRYWFWEIANMSLATVLLITVFVILAKFNGQPVSNWGVPMSLNTLLAIISTVFRATVIFALSQIISQANWYWLSENEARPLRQIQGFDFGSRGIFGAIALIPTVIRGNFPVLLAIVLSILSFLIGPFIQQSIGITECLQPVSGSASLPYAHYVPRKDGFCRTCLHGTLDTDAEVMMYSALTFPEGADNQIRPNCTTGNCTFPYGDPMDDNGDNNVTYSSIGLCHRCTNTTSLVKLDDPASYSSVYTLPNGPNVGIPEYDLLFMKQLPTVLNITTHDDLSWADDVITPEFRHILKWALVNITVLTCSDIGCHNETRYCPSPGPTQGEVVNGSTSVIAATCSLYPCVQTYVTSITNNVLTEAKIKSNPVFPDLLSSRYLLPSNLSEGLSILQSNGNSGLSNLYYHYAAVRSPCRVDGTIYSLQNMSSFSNVTTLALCEPSDDQFCRVTNISAPERCIYRHNAEFAMSLSLFLTNTFSNRSCINGQALDCGEGGFSSKWMETLYKSYNSPLARQGVYRGTATFESIDAFFKSFANSVTNRYRSTYGTSVFNKSDGGDNMIVYELDEVQGIAWQATVCTVPQLEWLLLPTGIVMFASSLLVWMVIQSWKYRHTQPTWKESILPFIFHRDCFKTENGIPINLQTALGLMNSVKTGTEDKGQRLLEISVLDMLAEKTPVTFKGT